MSDGGCLCGGVRYMVTGTLQSGQICHCVSCRRAAGAQSVAWLTFPSRDFSLIFGEPARYRSSAEVSRTFCSQAARRLHTGTTGPPTSST